MLNLKLKLQPHTEIKLQKVFKLYKDQEILAQHIIDFQISDLKKSILNVRLDLEDFEKKHQISTKVFYQSFKDGKLDDNEDFMIWAGIYELLRENLQKLNDLE